MRKRGITLVELLIGTSLLSFVLFGMTTLYISGLRSMTRANEDTVLSQSNAQGIRHVLETIREAVNVSVSEDGSTIVYNLPKRASASDTVTGEREILIPVVSDGVSHEFYVLDGKLYDGDTDRVLVDNLLLEDPDSGSSQYQEYVPPFQLNTIGSGRAVTVNLITSELVGGERRSQRMKSTVLLRNAQ
ncbi:MAG: hypothetical protein HZC36_10885 [Armatimonadetes bacterium]|nr:hypothetical protein [Armatimonadota bacterium]